MRERDEEGKLNCLKVSIILNLFLGLPPSTVHLLDPLCLSFPSCKTGIITEPNSASCEVLYNGLLLVEYLEHCVTQKCSLNVPHPY